MSVNRKNVCAARIRSYFTCARTYLLESCVYPRLQRELFMSEKGNICVVHKDMLRFMRPAYKLAPRLSEDLDRKMSVHETI